MITRQKTTWHRKVASEPNEHLGDNGLFQAINKEERLILLMEEINKKPELLKRLYVSKRRPPSRGNSEYPCWINDINESEYVDNDFVVLTPGNKSIAISCDDHELIRQIRAALKTRRHSADRAEINLIARILLASNSIETPSERLIGLQGGIGCGKTTLLSHLFIKAFPRVSSKLGLPKHVAAYADFRALSRYTEISKNIVAKYLLDGLRMSVPDLFASMRTEVATKGDLDFRETIKSLSKLNQKSKVEEMIAQRVAGYNNDPVLYLKDISAFYGQRKSEQLVLVADNVDHHNQDNQHRALEFLWEILVTDCPDSLGILPLREPTLCSSEIRDFLETRYLRVMHMTSIYISDMIRIRLNLRASEISENEDLPEVKIHKRGDRNNVTTLGWKSNKEFLDKWGNTFANQDMARKFRALYNNNMREVLSGAVTVMRSRHLNITKLLYDFYSSSDYNPKIYGKPWEHEISTDEILRLLLLQSYTFYDSKKKDALYNIFNSDMNPADIENQRRVPCLLRVRMFDAIRNSGKRGLHKNTAIKKGNYLGFSKADINKVLKEFMSERLVESLEGNVLSRVTHLYCTPKGSVFSWLFRTIIYLEHIIGDTFIDYEENLRQPHDSLEVDFFKVLNFIDFIRERECDELEFAKNRGEDHRINTLALINMYPLCFRLLLSVCARASDLRFWATSAGKEGRDAATWLKNKILRQADDDRLGGHYVRKDWDNLFNHAMVAKHHTLE